MRPLVATLVTDGFHPFEVGVACELSGMDRRELSEDFEVSPMEYRRTFLGARRGSA
jgi:hypothetical protein